MTNNEITERLKKAINVLRKQDTNVPYSETCDTIAELESVQGYLENKINNVLPLVNEPHDSKNELLKSLENKFNELFENGYTFLIVAGKDGVCAKYMGGNSFDLHQILVDMVEKNEIVGKVLKAVLEDCKD